LTFRPRGIKNIIIFTAFKILNKSPMVRNKLTYALLALFLLMMLTPAAHAQRIRGTVIAGGGLTQVEGDELKGWKQFGFTLGLGAIVPFAGNWGANIETLFTQKGSFQRSQFPGDSLTDEYRLRLNYFEVPVYVSYTDKEVMSFGLGAYWGRLVGVSEKEHSGNQIPYSDSVAFNDNDIGFLVDAKVRIWRRLHLGVRYTQSLTVIREREFFPQGKAPLTRKQFNQVINLRFIYIFNEPPREVVPR
jgi:hypothetical protein